MSSPAGDCVTIDRLRRQALQRLAEMAKTMRPGQSEAYKALLWLLDPDRVRQGRTTVIVMAIATTMLDHPGVEVPIFDTVPLLSNRRRVISLVRAIFNPIPIRVGTRFDWVRYDHEQRIGI